jgi:hypothetical protein
MDKCSCTQGEDESLVQPSPLRFVPSFTSDSVEQSSPILRALETHFNSYTGLTEPRAEIADIALRPQRDDL